MTRARQIDQPNSTSGIVASVVEARHRDVEGLSVRRILPARRVQTVGPFIFLDHFGPRSLAPGRGIDVPPHPHIHLATVTYLFEGELVHRDTLGSVQPILPGDINWMHAGSGIVHSERTGRKERELESRIEGIQLWVALPRALEETPPEFHHYATEAIPCRNGPGLAVRVLAGSAFGCHSPVKTASNTLYVDVVLETGAQLLVPEVEERAIYVASGNVSLGDEIFHASQMIVLGGGEAVFTAEHPSRVLILGGDPLDGPRHVWWNFVSSSRENLERAKRDWAENRFPLVPGDEIQRAQMPI
jgi:redox-sensitive bicupin YhaK (pirin superfamily)